LGYAAHASNRFKRKAKLKARETKDAQLAIALGVAAAVLFAGGVAWKADATTWRTGTLNLPGAAKTYSPIEKTACTGWGRHCPPGFHWFCGPVRCWCRPC